MTQANDLGAIANQPGAFFRARNNNAQQAIVTQHYGAAEPPALYPNMIWFSAGDGYIKIRNPTNTAWQNIGTIGPPLKWTTSVDLPQENFVTGDVKATYNLNQPAGWLYMNDGTIGGSLSGATTRANPDVWALFNLLWNATSDDWCSVYASGTSTRTGKGANSLTDWNANRHMLLPKSLGRCLAASGWGAGLSNLTLGTWLGQEFVALDADTLPSHNHIGADHAHWRPNHGHPYSVDTSQQSSWGSGGEGYFPTSGGGVQVAAYDGWPAGTDATVIGGGGGGMGGNSGPLPTSYTGGNATHINIQPTSYCLFFIKL